jgi:GLPGLI family protein
MSLKYNIPVLLLFLVGYAHSVKSQAVDLYDGLKIEYVFSQKKNEQLVSAKPEVVYISRSSSLSIISNIEERSIEREIDSDGTIKVEMKLTEDGDSFVYTDFRNNLIINKQRFFKEDFLIEDVIPEFDWKITGKEKDIANYVAYEATTNFRGRSYSAWFAPDLSLNGGPWKFSGLPGVILEVNDHNNNFSWNCSAVMNLTSDEKVKISRPSGRRKVSNDAFYDLMRDKIKSWLESIAVRANGAVISEVVLDESSFLEVTKK